MKKQLFYFLLLALSFSIQSVLAQVGNDSIVSLQKADSVVLYKVVGVKDGDTFVILMDGKEQIVRFSHIDCPEKNQAYGMVAKQFVSDHCFGKFIQLVNLEGFDRYNRLLAEIVLENGSNLNKELVKNGLAWHYIKYSSDLEYAALEEEARKGKIGLWSLADPVAPWEWRRRK